MAKAKKIHAGRYEYKGYELLNCGYHHPDHCIWWQAINMKTGCADYSCHTKKELIEEIEMDSGYELYDAVKLGKTELVQELIHTGADVNYVFKPEEYKLTPLHMAAYGAMDDIIELLIENGSEVNSYAIDGKTPLALAIERHNREQTVSLLIDHGAVEGTAPVPDYAKVGEVFSTSKNTYFLVTDDGSIQEFLKSEFHKVLEMREKLKRRNKEVEITFRDKNQARTNVYYGFSMPEV